MAVTEFSPYGESRAYSLRNRRIQLGLRYKVNTAPTSATAPRLIEDDIGSYGIDKTDK